MNERIELQNETIQKYNNLSETTKLSLHKAVLKNDIDEVKLLLKNGSDPNDRDEIGRTPLHCAAIVSSSHLLETLLENGASVDSKIQFDIKSTLELPNLSKHQYFGKTALHIATEQLDYDCVRVLLENKAEVNITDAKGLTPLFSAGDNWKKNFIKASGKTQYEKVVSLLLEWNANAAGSKNGNVLLRRAFEFESFKTFCEFLKRGVDPFVKDSNGDTILHLVSRSGEENFAKELLLKYPELVKEKNVRSETPLHSAALAGSRRCLGLLINAGGDLSQKNSSNLTVCDLIFLNVPRPLNFLVEILDSKVTPNEYSINDKNFKVTLDFEVLTPDAEQQTCVLISLINSLPYEQKSRIVLHPLVSTFIRLKWERLRILFFLLVVIHFMFVLSLSLHVCFLVKGQSMFVYKWSRYVLMSTSLVILAHNLTQISLAFVYFLKEFETWLTLICAFLSLTISMWETFCMSAPTPPLWIRHLAAYDILLSWILLMFVLGRFPLMGYVALMFYTVLKNVIKVLIFFACLVIGFSLSFCVQFNDMQFDDPWKAFVRTTIMLMGEYEYADLFNDEKIMKRFKEDVGNLFITSRIIFLLFVLLGSIVLVNLLTGLAVNDIQSLRAEGCLRHLIKQAEFISHIEKITTKNLNRRLMTKQLRKLLLKMQNLPRTITLHPNVTSKIYDKTNKKFNRLPPKLMESIMLGAIKNQKKNLKNDSENIILKDGFDLLSNGRNQWIDTHITDALNDIKNELHLLSLGLMQFKKEDNNI